MKTLDEAGLLEELTLKSETVKLSKGTVIVTELSSKGYMAVYSDPSVKDAEGAHDNDKFTALLAVRSTVNEKGERILSDEKATVFADGGSSTYQKIVNAVNRVNGWAGDAVKN